VINNQPFDGVVPFLAVADANGFRAAAERLGVTAAAVSRAVQRLEAGLGVRLFERTTRRVRLTREGERFAARCREALAQVRLAREEAEEAQAAPRGTIVISASPILPRLLVPSLARFARRHPGVRAALRLTDRIARFTDEDPPDVALRVGAVQDDSVVARPLVRPRWVTVASPGYLARRGAPRAVADLASHDCVRYATRGGVRPWTFRGGAVEVRGPLDVDLGESLVHAALGDLGVVQVLDFMVRPELDDGRLVEVLAEASAGGPAISLIHPAGRRLLPRVRAFVDFLAADLR
jgi:LysR family transcriptional regulator for bpeEF and oprC